MDNEKEYQDLKRRLKELSKKRFKRFNVLLKVEAFKVLEAEAKKLETSKAKTLAKMIKEYNK